MSVCVCVMSLRENCFYAVRVLRRPPLQGRCNAACSCEGWNSTHAQSVQARCAEVLQEMTEKPKESFDGGSPECGSELQVIKAASQENVRWRTDRSRVCRLHPVSGEHSLVHLCDLSIALYYLIGVDRTHHFQTDSFCQCLCGLAHWGELMHLVRAVVFLVVPLLNREEFTLWFVPQQCPHLSVLWSGLQFGDVSVSTLRLVWHNCGCIHPDCFLHCVREIVRQQVSQ